MCLIIFAHQAHPRQPLIIAANRDEFHQRPTQASHFWPERPSLLAGKDLQLGGTWMGITRAGRFAAVTNYRDPSRSRTAPRSRGELTANFLAGNTSIADYLQQVASIAEQYAGFNLLLGDGEQLWHYSNSPTATGADPVALSPGIYGLSNAQLDTPWPKVLAGKEALQQRLKKPLTHDALAEVTSSRQMASVTALKQQGLHGEMDQLLSAPFIVNQRYGTRAVTTLWTERLEHSQRQQLHWRERSFDEQGLCTGSVEESLELTIDGT